MGPFRRGALLLLAGLLVAAVALVILTKPGRAALAAVLLIPQVLPEVPFRPLEFFGAEPVRQDIAFPYEGAFGQAYLYRPKEGGPSGASVMFLGVGPDVESPDLHRVAQGLARLGVVTMILRPNGLALDRLEPEQKGLVVSAFEFLRAQPFVDPRRVGLVGYCTGASMVVMAAADPRIWDKVAFVNAFGPYFDIEEWIRALLGGVARYQNEEEAWPADPVTADRLRQHIIEMLATESDRPLLEALTSGGAAPPDEELSPAGRLALRLVQAQDPQTIDQLLTELPSEVRAKMAELSPRSVASQVRAPTFVMHDRGDLFIPYTESRHLAEALPPGTLAVYTEFALFEHVHATRSLDPFTFAGEVARLLWLLFLLLQKVV